MGRRMWFPPAESLYLWQIKRGIVGRLVQNSRLGKSFTFKEDSFKLNSSTFVIHKKIDLISSNSIKIKLL
mgnify:CR=1 FL=1